MKNLRDLESGLSTLRVLVGFEMHIEAHFHMRMFHREDLVGTP